MWIDGLNNHKPDLIIIDRKLKIKKNLQLFNLTKKRKTYVFTSSNDIKKILFLKRKNIKIIKIKDLESKKDFLKLFKKVFKLKKGRILLETGLVFLNRLFKFELIDNLYLFKSSALLANKGYNNINNNFIKRLKTKNKIRVNLEGDELFKIRIK